MSANRPSPADVLRALDRDAVREQNAEIEAEDYAITQWIQGGAPSPLALWRQSQGMPSPEDDLPLTVKQAAARLKVHTKTIRRRLPLLTAMDPPGAYKVGAHWRIVPAGLDALHEAAPASPTASPTRRPRARPSTRPTSPDTRW